MIFSIEILNKSRERRAKTWDKSYFWDNIWWFYQVVAGPLRLTNQNPSNLFVFKNLRERKNLGTMHSFREMKIVRRSFEKDAFEVLVGNHKKVPKNPYKNSGKTWKIDHARSMG